MNVYSKATELIQQGNYIDAIVIYNEYPPEKTNDLFNQGYCYLAIGDYELSKKIFHQIIQLEPIHEEALSYLSSIYNKIGQYDKSMVYAQRVLEISPMNYNALYDLMISNFNLGNGASALKLIDVLLKMKNDSKVLKKQMVLLNAKGDWVNCMTVCKELLLQEPDDAETLRNLGYSHYNLGNLYSARLYLIKSLLSNEQFSITWVFFAYTLLEMGSDIGFQTAYSNAQILDKSIERKVEQKAEFHSIKEDIYWVVDEEKFANEELLKELDKREAKRKQESL